MGTLQRLTLSVQGSQASRFGSHSRKTFDACDGSIGRSEDCDWVLSAEGVSRQHALVRFLNGIYFIEDRSTNGMMLNGAPLRRGDPSALKDGDRLQIDTFELEVKLDGDSATVTPVASDAPATLDLGPALSGASIDNVHVSHAPIDGSLIPGASPGSGASGGLDPLALFDEPFSLGEPVLPVAPASSWNHTPSISDRFRPPRTVEQREAAPVLPENWDLTHSQFAPIRLPEPEPAIDTPPPAAKPAPVMPPAPPLPDVTRDRLAPVEPTPTPPAATPAVVAAAAEPPVALTTPVPSTPADADIEAMLHIVIDGMMDALRARAELKNTFRLPVTIIQRRENNPLKFAPNAEEAVKKLLAPANDAFMSGTAALNDAVEDIRNHQMAMLAGVREAFQSLLGCFDPARFEQEGEGGRRLGFGHKSRPWERYRENFQNIRKHPDESFRRLFGDEFARAYEDQLARLKTQHAHEPKR